jgi:hypothetical protein
MFNKIVTICSKEPATREGKTDIKFLKKNLLCHFNELSKSIAQISSHFHAPFSDLDLGELAKVVTYRKVKKGQAIDPNPNPNKREIYVILKGNVRLCYPMDQGNANLAK